MSGGSSNSGNEYYKRAKKFINFSFILFWVQVGILILDWPFILQPFFSWLWNILVMILLLVGLGIGSNSKGKWYGALVDGNRNRVSLSRLQITLWTIIVISAFLSMTLSRTFHPLKEPTAEEISLCKADYIASVYDLDLADFEGEIPQSEEGVNLEQILEEADEECVPQPLKIIFPEELLLVLGISTASFAGSSIIKINKRNKPSEKTRNLQSDVLIAEHNLEINKNLFALDDSGWLRTKARDNIITAIKELTEKRTALEKSKSIGEGLLYVAEEPQFTDIFYGDQEGDHDFVDLGKVQMFFITVAILVSYGVSINGLLQDLDLIFAPFGVSFPNIPSSMATLLSISHAGYLTVKAPDRPDNSQSEELSNKI